MKYRVIEDLQGGSFGMDRTYSAEEWLEQMIEWRNADDSWGDYEIGADGYLDTPEGCRKYWKQVIADGDEQDLIDYISDVWQIIFEPVDEGEK